MFTIYYKTVKINYNDMYKLSNNIEKKIKVNKQNSIYCLDI